VGLLDRAADGPDEAQELSADGGDDVLLGFAAPQQVAIAPAEPMLGLPIDPRNVIATSRNLAFPLPGDYSLLLLATSAPILSRNDPLALGSDPVPTYCRT
jgi:hypothetical protein